MLIRGTLSNTAASIYTVSAPVKVKTIIFFNGGAGTNTVSLYDVPNNTGNVGTAGLSNQIMSIALPSGDTYEFSPAYPFDYTETNDSLQASATNASEVNYRIMGV